MSAEETLSEPRTDPLAATIPQNTLLGLSHPWQGTHTPCDLPHSPHAQGLPSQAFPNECRDLQQPFQELGPATAFSAHFDTRLLLKEEPSEPRARNPVQTWPSA